MTFGTTTHYHYAECCSLLNDVMLKVVVMLSHECPYAECCYAKCAYAERCGAKHHYDECHGTLVFALVVF
jgi:hypothetical protein